MDGINGIRKLFILKMMMDVTTKNLNMKSQYEFRIGIQLKENTQMILKKKRKQISVNL